jgi:hypothetical protein
LGWRNPRLVRVPRKAKTPPPSVQALYYVRNRVLHEGADALSESTVFVPGTYGSGPYGVGPYGGAYVTPAWRWRLSHELPRGRRSSKTGKAEYQSWLAGNIVAETLEAASAALGKHRRAARSR